MFALALLLLLAAPLPAELLEARIRFQGTGCLSCAESLKPRLARIRGMETVELDLERSHIHLKLAPGNKARIGPLRLRVTQDGTKILAMSVVVQGIALEKDGAWLLTGPGPNETLGLEAGPGVAFEPGQAYRLNGKVVEAEDGELTLHADSAEPIPQP